MTTETYHRIDFDYENAFAELRSEREQSPPPLDQPLGHLHVLRERLLESFARARLGVLSRHPMSADELAARPEHTLLVVFDDPRATIEAFQIPDAGIEADLAQALARVDHVDDPEGPSSPEAHVASVRVLNLVGRCGSLREVAARLEGHDDVSGRVDVATLERERGTWARYAVARYGTADDASRQTIDARLLDTRIDRVVILRHY